MKKIVLTLFVVAIILTGCGGSDSSSNKEEEPVTTWTTKSGQTCKVFTETPNDYKTAIMATVEELVPGAEADLSKKEWPFSQYDDGMVEVAFPVTKDDGYENGGTILMKFTDDKHESYEVHYLKVGPDVYRDTGVYDSDAYSEAE